MRDEKKAILVLDFLKGNNPKAEWKSDMDNPCILSNHFCEIVHVHHDCIKYWEDIRAHSAVEIFKSLRKFMLYMTKD